MTPTPADRLRTELSTIGVERFTARDYRPGPVVHIVLFRYLADTSSALRQEAIERFLALAETHRHGAPYIASIAGGPPAGGESAESGFEHGFVVTFSSAGDRNYYVGEPVVSDARFYDPVHAEFKRFVAPLLAPNGVVVFDIGA